MCFAAALQGWLVREARAWERAVLLVAAFLLIKPGLVTDAIGLLLLALVFVVQKIQVRNAAVALSDNAPESRNV
jgi:TRAP-type uncharacterized transport system fused permease subunit